MGLDINALVGGLIGFVSAIGSGVLAARYSADATKEVARTEARATLDAIREEARLAQDAAERAEAAATDTNRADAIGALLAASAALRRALGKPDTMGDNVESAQTQLGAAAGRAKAAGAAALAAAAHAAAQADSAAAAAALDALDARLRDDEGAGLEPRAER